jgi:ribosomal protein L24E
MKLLKKILKQHTEKSKKPEGVCDLCQITIWQGDQAMCFHTDSEELFLCENCIEKVYGEYSKEWVE